MSWKLPEKLTNECSITLIVQLYPFQLRLAKIISQLWTFRSDYFLVLISRKGNLLQQIWYFARGLVVLQTNLRIYIGMAVISQKRGTLKGFPKKTLPFQQYNASSLNKEWPRQSFCSWSFVWIWPPYLIWSPGCPFWSVGWHHLVKISFDQKTGNIRSVSHLSILLSILPTNLFM